MVSIDETSDISIINSGRQRQQQHQQSLLYKHSALHQKGVGRFGGFTQENNDNYMTDLQHLPLIGVDW